MSKQDRGFASMDAEKRRKIASLGGKAAHRKGTAHEWTSDEAKTAGRKGGLVTGKRRQEQEPPLPLDGASVGADVPGGGVV